MAFDTYQELQDEIKSFLWDRADVVARIPSFISLAEAEARRLLRTREMNDSRQFTVSAEIASIPCGAGQIKGVRVTDGAGSRNIDYLSPEQFMALSPDSVSDPRFYTVQNEKIYFHPQGPFTGEILFVEAFEPLSNVCRSNWLLKRHPDIYLCGALKWGKAWLVDGDWDWASPFYAAIEAANADTPRVQTNTKVRADEVAILGGRRGFNVYTGGL